MQNYADKARSRPWHKAYLEARRRGESIGGAALAAGVDRNTPWAYMRSHPEFAAVDERAVQDCLDDIEGALLTGKFADDGWRRAAWVLERRMPNKYGKDAGQQQTADAGNREAVVNLFRRWLFDRLRPYQQDAIYGPENRKYLEFYPQSGKTEAACSWLVDRCLDGESGQIYWWLSGVYDQSINAWRRIRDLIAGYGMAEVIHREIRFHNGVTLKFMSAGSGSGNFGDSVSGMVIDESSDIDDESWAAAMSRTTATNGPMRIIGNRRGRGRFYQECREAEYRADGTLTMLTAQQGVELGLWTQEAYEAKRQEIAPALFSELYDLQDVDAMNPFVGYERRIRPLSEQPAVCYGVDIARYPAYYAMIGLDDAGRMSYENAWRGQAYETSAAMVKAIAGDLPVLVDATGAEAHMEQLRSAGVNAWPYQFTTTSRQELLERLAVGIASETVTITTAVQQQMQRFEIKHGPAGVRYETPVKDTIGDDRVMALALAWWLHDQGTLTRSRGRRRR